jgi:hypothetical protein
MIFFFILTYLLAFPSNLNKKEVFSHFVGFSKCGTLCFPEELLQLGAKKMNRRLEYEFETDFKSVLFEEREDFHNRNIFICETLQLRKPSLKDLNATQYLSSVESYISEELISSQNFTEIKNLASYFNGGITSFFGFESRLSSLDARADYLFAVSSQRGEREAFASLFTNKTLPEAFLNQKEWQNVGKFSIKWADRKSVLHNKVLGLWLEFDTAASSSEPPVPSIFIQVPPLLIDSPEDIQKCHWLIHTALPLLSGQPLTEKMQKNLLNAIQQMPKTASVTLLGSMLSRKISGIRLVIYKISPKQIIPYLTSLGWVDENNGLTQLLEELSGIASRIVLHINITENGVDQKIGLECAYYPDQYALETNWQKFFDYLIQKNACLPEKKAVILDFLGVEQDDSTQKFDSTSYQVAARIHGNDFSAALVRYISHIKICYTPSHPIEAKAYPGIRLFGQTKINTGVSYQ